MAYIELERLEVGMIISNDVYDKNGRILLRSGSEITDVHRKKFKMWGIAGADIRIDGCDEDDENISWDELTPTIQKAAKEHLANLFVLTDESEVIMAEIQRLALDRIVKRLVKRDA